ncbi:MAG TPA: plasmid partitioning protein RepB [Mesorhizobium sp.]|jgi:ParB family chromosome partitioning protein|uniref:plasmid partitioning protein RepB n=1 Tax=Mesorhizobium sp. TaxID=1871066 RepID=UPI002DDCB93D|nr:plasmid partitioning protein RepB [Mesorhizobium sp.]HEV2501843.1 plasmid partitioning protein RepB [Mesorhizobium sp.]
MSRKQIFANLTPPVTDVEKAQASVQDALPRRASRIRPLLGSPDLVVDGDRSPVGALGQSLGELSERTRRADEIEEKLRAGQTVVEIDPATVDPSFVPDRMFSEDDAFRSFVESIREQGQQVPILVRPHPEKVDAYQVAFGHRRLRAAQELKIPVKAIVRDLTDQELVVAQGQENNDRQDLSYIEKVRFAQKLTERFSRDVIMSALGVYKSDLSNMLAVAAKIPTELVEAIGPAHGIGRRNWMALAEAMAAGKGRAQKALSIASKPEVAMLASKERFEVVAQALSEKTFARDTSKVVLPSGQEIAHLAHTKQRVTLMIDRRTSPDFAEFVMNELPRLYADHLKSR